MAEITIPAVVVKVCDRCGIRSDAEVHGQSPFYARSAKLKAFDTIRDTWADSGSGTVEEYDLCCNCCKQFDSFMQGNETKGIIRDV